MVVAAITPCIPVALPAGDGGKESRTNADNMAGRKHPGHRDELMSHYQGFKLEGKP